MSRPPGLRGPSYLSYSTNGSSLSSAVSILPMEQVEQDLILEEVDPCWEDTQQEDSASLQETEMVLVYEEESEVMVEMPRWENREVLGKRLSA